MNRDVLQHSSARPNQVEIHVDELVKTSACPSNEYDFSQTYQFRTDIFSVRTNIMSLEILDLVANMIFPLSTSLLEYLYVWNSLKRLCYHYHSIYFTNQCDCFVYYRYTVDKGVNGSAYIKFGVIDERRAVTFYERKYNVSLCYHYVKSVTSFQPKIISLKVINLKVISLKVISLKVNSLKVIILKVSGLKLAS